VGEGTTPEQKATTPDHPRLMGVGAQEDPRDPVRVLLSFLKYVASSRYAPKINKQNLSTFLATSGIS